LFLLKFYQDEYKYKRIEEKCGVIPKWLLREGNRYIIGQQDTYKARW